MEKIRTLLSSQYPLNLDGLPMPFEFKYFKAFEAKNPTIGLRVYHHDRELVTGPLYVNADTNRRPVHLLFISHPEKDSLPGHFRPITNMHAMVNGFDKSQTSRTPYHCELCLQRFRTATAQSNHLHWCGQSGKKQKVHMPMEDEHRFKDHQKTTHMLNVIYADMESKIDPVTHLHTPGYIGSMQVWHPEHAEENNTYDVDIFKGDDCVMKFLDYLEDKARENVDCLDLYTRQPMEMSAMEQQRHNASMVCDFCEQSFSEERLRCADHDHITGCYLRALCSQCNLRRVQYRRRMSVVFHNLKGYDGHHLMRYGLANKLHWDINPIYQSGDKLLGVIVRIPLSQSEQEEEGEEYGQEEEEESDNDGGINIIDGLESMLMRRRRRKDYYTINFIDSFQFLPSSLQKLIDALPNTPISQQMLTNAYEMSMEDGRRISKAIFPYTFFTSFDVLQSTTDLPPISAFYNDLTERECSREAYASAQEAWNSIGCHTLEEYLIYYLKLDVAGLADIFETFRRDVFQASELDATHYFGSPGLSLAWFFKHTGARPDMLKDPAMYEMFEHGIRGGMTVVNIHEATTDTSNVECQQHIAYIDENNLYGHSMSMKQPYKDFQWLSESECSEFINTETIQNFDAEGDLGFLAEVDLEYPPDVQEATLDLPLAPEAGSIGEEQLSPYMKRLWTHYYGMQSYHGTQKLLLTHYPKQRYIVHSRALCYYVEKGLRITRCHRAILFQQRAFMKEYVDYHTTQRSQATTISKKNLHKYMVNSLFGKTMEDVRQHLSRRLTHSPSILFRNANSPLCESVMPLGEETIVVTMRKTSVLLCKAIFIGQCILDASKIVMYRLLDQLKSHPTLSDVQLIGGDTDSFFLRLQSPYSLDEIWRSLSNFDSSNYPLTHPLHSNTNKARLGCFKDEACGRRITSFVALSPKMYSFVVDHDTSELNNRVKGIKTYKKHTLTHELYQQAYRQHQIISIKQTLLQSREHTIHTVTQQKRALSVWEDKRFWLSANVSYPYGYHRIPSLLKDNNAPTAKRPRI